MGALLQAARVARSETFSRSALPRSERRTLYFGVSPPLESPDAQFLSRARNFPITLPLPRERGGRSAAGLRARTKPRSLIVHLFYSNPGALPGLGRRGARTRDRWRPSTSARAPSSSAQFSRGLLLHPIPVFKASSVNNRPPAPQPSPPSPAHAPRPQPPSGVGPG